jgi:hypothetical protein
MPEKILFPQHADLASLKKFHRRVTTDLGNRSKAAHAAFLREAALKAKALAPVVNTIGARRRAVEQAALPKRRQLRDLVRRGKPTPFKPLREHNPARYAPFDFSWPYINCGGITACSLYGPNSGSGQIGADLGVFNGGGAGAASAVGFWHYAQYSGTLHVTVQASVWGRGYVYSALFGYASAWCALRTYVYRYAPFTSWMASADIYNDWGVVEFDVRYFNWESRSVSISVPVVAGNWYEIWGAAYQSAYAGGIADSVSNFDMYVGPIWYTVR